MAAARKTSKAASTKRTLRSRPLTRVSGGATASKKATKKKA